MLKILCKKLIKTQAQFFGKRATTSYGCPAPALLLMSSRRLIPVMSPIMSATGEEKFFLPRLKWLIMEPEHRTFTLAVFALALTSLASFSSVMLFSFCHVLSSIILLYHKRTKGQVYF